MGIIDMAFSAVGEIAIRSRKGIKNRKTPILAVAPHPTEVGSYMVVARATTQIRKKKRMPIRYYVRLNDQVVWARQAGKAFPIGTMEQAERVRQILLNIGEGREG